MKFVILGAAGQARELDYYLRDLGHTCAGFVVSDVSKLTRFDSRERVVGDPSWIDAHVDEVEAFALGVGTPAKRLRVAAEFKSRYPHIPFPPIVHATATFDRSSTKIGEGVIIGPNATLTVNVVLDDFSMVNFGASIGHDVSVARGSIVNPGANISGGVEIGQSVLVGAGAVVLQYLRLGEGSIVGAGAVVTKDVPSNTTVVGVPARAR